MKRVGGELHDAKIQQSCAVRERKEAIRSLKETQKQLARVSGELEASKESGLAHSLQATANEMRLKEEVFAAEERIEIVEKELAAFTRTPRVTPSRVEAKARILQAENEALRAQAGASRRKHRELTEALAMASEEIRGR